MNSLSGIRNINAQLRDQSEDRLKSRYQRQYRGDQWAVFDSHTGGWGQRDDSVAVIDKRVDELNEAEAQRINDRIEAARHDHVGSILSVGAVLAKS